jgi:ubiquinone biosynthesis protein UbiJ
LDAQPFSVRVGELQLDARRGAPAGPIATIATDPGTLQQVLWHGRPLREAIRSGELEITGDRRAAERLLGLFPLPR